MNGTVSKENWKTCWIQRSSLLVCVGGVNEMSNRNVEGEKVRTYLFIDNRDLSGRTRSPIRNVRRDKTAR